MNYESEGYIENPENEPEIAPYYFVATLLKLGGKIVSEDKLVILAMEPETAMQLPEDLNFGGLITDEGIGFQAMQITGLKSNN